MSMKMKVAIVAAIIVAPIVIWFLTVAVAAEKSAKFMSDFEKIHDRKSPLTTAQVEQIMGQPLRIEHAETTGITGDVYHFPTYPPGGDFQVIFVNGTVFNTAIPSYTQKS